MFTMMSRRPVSRTARVDQLLAPAATSRTSRATTLARPPAASMRAFDASIASRVRPARKTWAPAAPRRSAIARPMPLDAPVTIAVLPARGICGVMGSPPGAGPRLTEGSIPVNSVRMATRQRIVDAALLTFGRYGYRQASMEAVAEQAALSRQALYRHFPTKEALFAAVVEDLHGSALAAAAGAAQEAREQGGDATAVLLAQLEARFATILARLHGSAHAEELQDENSRQCGAIAAEAGRRFVALLAATIRAERRAGRLALPRGLAAGELAESLVAAARGIKAAVPPPSADAFRRELGRMVRWLVAGASGPAAAARRGR